MTSYQQVFFPVIMRSWFEDHGSASVNGAQGSGPQIRRMIQSPSLCRRELSDSIYKLSDNQTVNSKANCTEALSSMRAHTI